MGMTYKYSTLFRPREAHSNFIFFRCLHNLRLRLRIAIAMVAFLAFFLQLSVLGGSEWLTGENGISLLVALIPVPLVDLGFRNGQSAGERLDLLHSPVGVSFKLSEKDLALEPVHPGHQPLAVGLQSVTLGRVNVLEPVYLEEAHFADVVRIGLFPVFLLETTTSMFDLRFHVHHKFWIALLKRVTVDHWLLHHVRVTDACLNLCSVHTLESSLLEESLHARLTLHQLLGAENAPKNDSHQRHLIEQWFHSLTIWDILFYYFRG